MKGQQLKTNQTNTPEAGDMSSLVNTSWPSTRTRTSPTAATSEQGLFIILTLKVEEVETRGSLGLTVQQVSGSVRGKRTHLK